MAQRHRQSTRPNVPRQGASVTDRVEALRRSPKISDREYVDLVFRFRRELEAEAPKVKELRQ